MFRFLLSIVSVFSFSTLVFANVSGELGLELRYFPEEGQNDQNKFQPSLRGELEYSKEYEDDSFEFVAFTRLDREDPERTHFDIREAAWTHVGDEWELKAGITKVFWGLTESRHLVDVINQTDLVENTDGEDKLGQLMVKNSFEKSWGTVDVFWLPYFRERTFPGKDGRFNLPLRIDTDRAEYESSAEEWHSDFALRYSHYIDDFEFAIAHFSGTSRDPLLETRFVNNEFILVPVYQTVDQTSLELQYLYEDWIFKFEGISNSGLGRRYSAAVAGFEYTQVGIFDSSADLGWIAEYLFDDRKDDPAGFLERDIFVGWRYAFNDADSSEILLGGIYDPKTGETLYSLEANQRLTNSVKLNLEVRLFEGAEEDDETFAFRDEDHVQVELVKYF